MEEQPCQEDERGNRFLSVKDFRSSSSRTFGVRGVSKSISFIPPLAPPPISLRPMHVEDNWIQLQRNMENSSNGRKKVKEM